MPEWVALGDRAIRFARPPVAARTLVHAIRAWPDVIDVVVAQEHVAVYFARSLHGVATLDACQARDLERSITGLTVLPDDPTPARDVELHAIYDGPDLADIAARIGLTTDEVVSLHAAATYTVETMGFAPGFAYLSGLDPRLAVPRRTTPRTRVPAGSLAIAGSYTTVYPFDSPGGWNLIGRVGARMFGPAGSRLALGDRVRFVAEAP